MSKKTFAIFALSSTISCLASAAEVPGFYVGASLGKSDADAELNDFAGLDDGSITSASLDTEDTNYGIFLGYQLNKYFAVEGGYTDLGESINLNAVSDGSGSLYAAGAATLDIDSKAWQASIIGGIPVTDAFSIYGRLGMAFWELEGTISNGAFGSLSVSEDDNDIYYGAGVRYDLEKVALRAEYTAYEFDDAELDSISASLMYKF